VRAAPGRVLTLTLEHDGVRRDVKVTPDTIQSKDAAATGRLGFAPKDDPALREAMFTNVDYAPLAALRRAVTQTWETSVFTLRMMGRMVLGQVSLKNLSGPLTIADYAGQSAQLGMPYYVKFLALISISIGVLNLLPIPVLDGGHLMYYLAEFLRGKPLPERVFEVGQRVGLTLLLCMMGIALFNDLNRQFFG
jgi:regulator of sigma E protease